eukprot:151572-Amphidinium_carterae.1
MGNVRTHGLRDERANDNMPTHGLLSQIWNLRTSSVACGVDGLSSFKVHQQVRLDWKHSIGSTVAILVLGFNKLKESGATMRKAKQYSRLSTNSWTKD